MPAPHSPASASEDELAIMLRRVRPLHRALVHLVEQHLAHTGISRPMRAVLEQVSADGAQTVPQLARVLAVRRQFVQRVVNDLIAAGLVERRVNAAHRRSWLIAPTAAGRRVFGELRRREREQLAPVAGELAGADVECCSRVLDYLARRAEELAATDALIEDETSPPGHGAIDPPGPLR